MRSALTRAKAWVSRHEKGLLWGMIALYVVLFTAVSLWKSSIYAYDGIDLAYFNQTFWNALHGRFFTQSIHPHSTLGDHAELVIPLLTLVYALAPGPEGLLFMQTAALGLAAWPLFLIAKERMRKTRRDAGSLTPLLMALAWLVSPFVQNINLFEFHILPFALVPLLFSLRAYEKGRKLHFLMFALAALLVREDVALVIAAIGILAWLERKPLWWRITPTVLGAAWFLLAMRLIGHFAPAGDYKYLIYYSWLGDSLAGIAAGAVLHPLRLLSHLLTPANLEMLLGFGMPLLFLPYLRPKRLILAAGPALQILLGAPGGGELVLQTHYATLFLPALFLAGLDGLLVLRHRTRSLFGIRASEFFTLARVCLIVAAVFGMLALGPIPAAFSAIASGAGRKDAAIADAMVAMIPPDASVAASYRLLPRLSSRQRLISLHYVFLGVTQFGAGDYPVPEDIRYVALDTDDLRTYRAQFLRTAWAEPHYAGGHDRLKTLAGQPAFADDRYALYDRRLDAEPVPKVALSPVPGQAFRDGIALDGAALTVDEGRLNLYTSWSNAPATEDGAVIRLKLRDERGKLVVDRAFPFGNGIRPVGSLHVAWESGPGIYFPEVSLEKEKAVLVVNGFRSGQRRVTETTDLGYAALPAFELR